MQLIVLFFNLIHFSAEISIEKQAKNRIFISPNTNLNELDVTYITNKEIEFIVFDTSYSNQITIDTSSSLFRSHSFTHYSFKSLNNNNPEYIYLKTDNYYYDLYFRSIFVTFSSNNIYIYNLTLFEAPICSINDKINLTVDYFKSDFLSIPKVNVSSIYINKEFVFLEELSNGHNINKNIAQNHATIVLSPHAEQKIIRNPKESDNSYNQCEYFESNNLKDIIEKVQHKPNSHTKSENAYLLNDESIPSNSEFSQESDSIPSDSDSTQETENGEDSQDSESDSLSFDSTSENEEFTSSYDSELDSFTPIPTPTESPDDFDDNETNTENVDFYFNSSLSILEIYNNKVNAIYENQKNETVEVNSTGHINVYTDSKSLTLKYLDEANFINSLKLNIILTTETIIIFDQSWRIFGDQVISSVAINHLERNLLTLMTDLDEVPYVTVVPMVNVRYVPERLETESYCLCTNSRLEECIENRECFLYSIPVDNYYSSSNSIISDIVANSKAETINLYLTSLTTLHDYHQFLIRSFFRGRKTLNFISVNPNEQVNLILFDLSQKIDRNKLIVNCIEISDLMVALNYDNTIDTLVLKNSPIRLIKTLSIHNFETDCYSLNRRQSDTIYIIKSLTINRADFDTIGIKFILRNDASIYIQQISSFPSITLTQSQVSFSGNECEFSVGFEGNCNVKISERTNSNPTVTIRSDVPFNIELKMVIDFILDNSLIIDFTDSLPFPNGLEINFIPNDEVLTSLELIMMDSSNIRSQMYSSTSDQNSFRLFPFGNITGNIDLILSSPETVKTFMTSLHNNDFSVSNLSQISMNFNDNLMSVTFYDESIVAKVVDDVGYSLELRFDRLFITGQMTIISNTSNTITLALNYSEFLNLTDFNDVIPGLTSKMQDFVLKTIYEKSSSVFFDDTFAPFMNNSVLSKIKVDHGKNNIELKTNLATVPNIEVIDDIAGVLYYAKMTTINLTKSFNESEICNNSHNFSSSNKSANCNNQNKNNNGCNDNNNRKNGGYKVGANEDDSHVNGVDANFTEIECQFNTSNYRSGPNITVYIRKSGLFVNQNQFLAENVTFIGEPFTFITKTKSRCNYNFVDIQSLSIVPTESLIDENSQNNEILNTTEIFDLISESPNTDFMIDINSPSVFTFIDEINNNRESLKLNFSSFELFFRAKYLTLKNTPINVIGKNVLLIFNYLKSDILSLSSFGSLEQSIAADIFTLADDESMKHIVIDSNSLSANCQLSENFDSKSSSQKKIESKSFESELNLFDQNYEKNCHTPFVTSSLFIIHYTSPDVLYVSLLRKEISSKFYFVMESKTNVHIYLDNSWYQAENADLVTFVIVNAKTNKNAEGQKIDLYSESELNVTIETALYELPNIRVVDSSLENITYTVILYDPVFDAKMSFYIFISLASAVAIVSIVFMFMNFCCIEKFAVEDEKTATDISSGSRRGKKKLKITKTSNTSSDSSEEVENVGLKNEKEKVENDHNFVVDDSSEADDERSDMSLNIDVDV